MTDFFAWLIILMIACFVVSMLLLCWNEIRPFLVSYLDGRSAAAIERTTNRQQARITAITTARHKRLNPPIDDDFVREIALKRETRKRYVETDHHYMREWESAFSSDDEEDFDEEDFSTFQCARFARGEIKHADLFYTTGLIAHLDGTFTRKPRAIGESMDAYLRRIGASPYMLESRQASQKEYQEEQTARAREKAMQQAIKGDREIRAYAIEKQAHDAV